MTEIFRASEATGVGTLKRYNNMLADYGDFGAYQRIAYTSLTGAYNFINIPQTYQDLMLVIYTRDTNAATVTTLFNYLNNDGATNYSYTYLDGNGSSASSGRTSNTAPFGGAVQIGASATSGIFSSNVMHILNYANTTTYKTVLWRSAADANGSGNTRLTVGLYRSTAAVTQVYVNPASGFASGSTAALYGIRAGNS